MLAASIDTNYKHNIMTKILFTVLSTILLISCNQNKEKKIEQLTYNEYESNKVDSSGLNEKYTFQQIPNSPSSVMLTGIDEIKLIPIYKIKKDTDKSISYIQESSYREQYENERLNFRYFMPGMDLISGYNLINVAHYNLATGQLSYFFKKPALIRNLYFPGVRHDSLNGQPIARNFFLLSAYDEDTNKDSLINKKDFRRIYFIDKINSQKISLIPNTHSAIRSTYDYKSDIMYVYARHDTNKNGVPDKSEPINIFLINMQIPTESKKIL
jgi:hypothetical protein